MNQKTTKQKERQLAVLLFFHSSLIFTCHLPLNSSSQSLNTNNKNQALFNSFICVPFSFVCSSLSPLLLQTSICFWVVTRTHFSIPTKVFFLAASWCCSSQELGTGSSACVNVCLALEFTSQIYLGDLRLSCTI